MIDNKSEQVAAQVMGCNVDEVRVLNYDHYGLKVFSDGGIEFAIGTDSECEQAVRVYILDSVWSFRPEFVASHTKAGVTNGMIKAIQALQESCESCNEDVKSLIEDLDNFVSDAFSADGCGMFLSPYDSEEQEIVIDGEYFYGYRLNRGVVIMVEPIQLWQVKNLHAGQTIYAIGYYNSDGTAQRFTVQGKPKLWKRNSARVEVTLKRGFKEIILLTELCLEEFSFEEPEPMQKPKRCKRV